MNFFFPGSPRHLLRSGRSDAATGEVEQQGRGTVESSTTRAELAAEGRRILAQVVQDVPVVKDAGEAGERSTGGGKPITGGCGTSGGGGGGDGGVHNDHPVLPSPEVQGPGGGGCSSKCCNDSAKSMAQAAAHIAALGKGDDDDDDDDGQETKGESKASSRPSPSPMLLLKQEQAAAATVPRLTREEAAARITTFLARAKRLRPVNRDDPVTLEPVDLSTSFLLVSATGVVSAVDAVR